MSRKKAQQSTKNQAIRESEKLRQESIKLNSENMQLKQENQDLKRQLEAIIKPNEKFKKPKKLSEEDVEMAKVMRKRGKSNAKIGEEFGVTEGTIRKYLKQSDE